MSSFTAGDRVSWRTINKTESGVLVREIVEGMRVWIVETEHGALLPVHENSMRKMDSLCSRLESKHKEGEK